MKGWVVTWNGTEEGLDRGRIVAVYNYRRSPEQVRKAVEQLYIDLKYDEEEKVEFAANPKNNPCPAQVDQLSRITCGHNPWLYARLVNNIRRSGDDYTWNELNAEAMQQ